MKKKTKFGTKASFFMKVAVSVFFSLSCLLSKIPDAEPVQSASGVAAFPQSYQEKLKALQEKYPQWVFVAVPISSSWDRAVKEESYLGRSLIMSKVNDGWKSTASGAYNWETDTFIAFDGSSWVNASPEIIAYYMDPRNFLSETQIFQFLSLQYDSASQNVAGVERLLKGSFMDGKKILNLKNESVSYAQAFVDAAMNSGVSAYHLVSRVLQEVGVSGSGSTSGVYGNYPGFYNFFNIQATSSADPVSKGLEYASQTDSGTGRPWDSPYKSIYYGAQYLAKNYIRRSPTQDTVYFQKFDVKSGGFWHQYMTNIQSCESEALILANIYKTMLFTQAPLRFEIPVYTNMPAQTSPLPAANGNPNHWLTTVSFENYTMQPAFQPSITEGYTIRVPASVSSVSVKAQSASSKAAVVGTGSMKDLKVGSNKITLKVTAQNGSVRTYTFDVIREEKTGLDVTDSPYRITEESFIRGLAPETNTKTFVEQLSVGAAETIHVLTPDRVEITDMDKNLGTGTIVEVRDSAGGVLQSFQIVLTGDSNGDGRITSTDLTQISRHVLMENALGAIYTFAADANGDGRVSSTDLTLICRHVLRESELVQ